MYIAKIEKMTIHRRLEATEELWDSITRKQGDVPSPGWHNQVLKSRKKRIGSGDAEYMTLEQFRKQFR